MSNIHLSNAIIFEQIFKQELTLKKRTFLVTILLKNIPLYKKYTKAGCTLGAFAAKGLLRCCSCVWLQIQQQNECLPALL